MKKLLSFTGIILAVTFFTGCGKVIDKIFNGFDVDVPSLTVTLPVIPLAPPFEIPLGSFTQAFNLDSIVKARTNKVFGAEDVNSVKIKTINFSLLNADNTNNVSNFESARFTFESDTNTTPVEIAAVTFPDQYDTAFVYTAPASAPELKDYLKGTQLTYKFFGQARRTTSKPLKLVVRVKLTVK